jgi:hypothetical protein
MAEHDPIPLPRKAQDLTGRAFGKLTALQPVGRKSGRVLWLCQCECGNEKVVASNVLMTEADNRVRSCGCLKKPPLEECLKRRVTNWQSGRVDVCWEWTGGGTESGYGRTTRDGKGYTLPRLVYERYVGPIPEGLWVLHRCDNPRCVNPTHLFLGTHKDNMADMVAKGRHCPVSGERNKSARLTEAQVREMRLRRQAGEQVKVLAGEYGVSGMTVSKITRGLKWRHVT